MKVPFFELKRQYESIKQELDESIATVLKNGFFVNGAYLKKFERSIESIYGIKHCIGVANGTDALFISLKSLDIGPGDEVIVPALSYVATASVVTHLGAKPVFVDIDPSTMLMDINQVTSKITKNTKAIIPVHLYGRAVEMNLLMSIADSYQLKVVEDCSQAHFAVFEDIKVGKFGDLGAFSCYPTKPLGAFGDAGFIITSNDDIAMWIRAFTNHQTVHYRNHIALGINSRLDDLQSAVLDVKLKFVDQWISRRNTIASYYYDSLSAINGITLLRPPNNRHTYHLFVVQSRNRERFRDKLYNLGIETAIHYKDALPFLGLYKEKKTNFPAAWEASNKIVSIPMYAELTDEEVDYITIGIKKASG